MNTPSTMYCSIDGTNINVTRPTEPISRRLKKLASEIERRKREIERSKLEIERRELKTERRKLDLERRKAARARLEPEHQRLFANVRKANAKSEEIVRDILETQLEIEQLKKELAAKKAHLVTQNDDVEE